MSSKLGSLHQKGSPRMTVISDWIKTELHGLGNMNIGRSAEMTDSNVGNSKNKDSFKVFCKRWVDELPAITLAVKSLKWIKTFAVHNNVGVECKGQVYFQRSHPTVKILCSSCEISNFIGLLGI